MTNSNYRQLQVGYRLGGSGMKQSKIGSYTQTLLRLDPASQNRLFRFRKDLCRDKDTVIFDSKLKDLVLHYSLEPKSIKQEINFLNQLRDEDGFTFCQSRKQYSKLEVQLERFAENNYPSFRWNENYQAALKWMALEFSNATLQPLTYHSDEEIRDALPKVDTHSGFTYIITGKKRKGDNLEGSYQLYTEVLDGAGDGLSFNRPILPGVRTQGSAYDEEGSRLLYARHKTRLVSMVDLFQIINEMTYAIPFQRWMASWSYYAGGKDPWDIDKIIQNDRSSFNYYLSLDYSSFDQSLSDWLIEDAFSLLFDAFMTRDARICDIIVNDFIHKAFVSGDGVIYSDKGVPSGSMFTQIIDSICNILMIKTYLLSKGLKGHMIVMGDDNLLYTDKAVDKEDISSYLRLNFGTSVNPSKTDSGTRMDSPKFLSREWRKDGQWRHPNVLLSRMLYPERWRDYKSGNADPIEVFYAYILTYPVGMRELVDVDSFLFDNKLIPNRNADIRHSRHLTGVMKYVRDYLLDKDIE
jgi:hypothetical protein